MFTYFTYLIICSYCCQYFFIQLSTCIFTLANRNDIDQYKHKCRNFFHTYRSISLPEPMHLSMGQWCSVGCASPYHGLGQVRVHARLTHALVKFCRVCLTISGVRICQGTCLADPSVGGALTLCCNSAKQFHTTVPLTVVHLLLQSSKGLKTSRCCSFQCQKSHAKVSIKAKNAAEIKIRTRKNVTAMVGQNYTGSKCNTVTSCPFFARFQGDDQFVPYGSECFSSKTLQGPSVTVVKRPSSSLVRWTFHMSRIVVQSISGWTYYQGTHSEKILNIKSIVSLF